MKAECFVAYLKNHYLKISLKSDWINEKMSLFDAIKYMRDHILRRRPDRIAQEKIGEIYERRITKGYRYYSRIDKDDSQYIPLDDQEMVAESTNVLNH